MQTASVFLIRACALARHALRSQALDDKDLEPFWQNVGPSVAPDRLSAHRTLNPQRAARHFAPEGTGENPHYSGTQTSLGAGPGPANQFDHSDQTPAINREVHGFR